MAMEEKMLINNVFDYSNVLPSADRIAYLSEYCDQIYRQFIKMTEEDEEKNKPYKDSYKQYSYKKSFGTDFEIVIWEKGFTPINCRDIQTFKSAIDGGKLKAVEGVDIKLDLDFKRGSGNNLLEHENSFYIIFKPYNIKFTRKSNYNDQEMNQIESSIKEILNQFTVANTIYCDKS